MRSFGTMRLSRIVRPSQCVTGNRRDSVDGAGWAFAHVAIDDHSRASFVNVRRRVQGLGGAFSQDYRSHLRVPRRGDQATVDRQQQCLPLPVIRQDVQAQGIRHTFTPLSAANQRQGQAFHSNLLARMSLRQGLEQQCGTHCLACYNARRATRLSVTNRQLGLPGTTYCNSTASHASNISHAGCSHKKTTPKGGL